MTAAYFYLQHGAGTCGPFRTESVQAVERGGPQKRRGAVVATRFMVIWHGRRYRVFSDRTRHDPHFIRANNERITVTGVSP